MSSTELQDRGSPRHRLRAFGLDIDAGFAAPGLSLASGGAGAAAVSLDWMEDSELERDWPRRGQRRLQEERLDGSRRDPARTIDWHPAAGYRLHARHFGTARIAPDGSWVRCTRPHDELWSWQRFLVGRVLPWTAVLRGLEAFHASAVALGGGAVAFCGPTGWGKTSLALRLLARGPALVTDDVLALEVGAGELLCHPGAALLAVRDAERDALGEAVLGRLGTILGHSGKSYLAVARMAPPLPLRSMYFLTSGPGAVIEPLLPAAQLLLGGTFVLGIQTPERLRTQLEVCSLIARRVPCFRLRPTAAGDAGALAAAVLNHSETLEAA